ncbi:MAG: hypothetical protein QXM98_03700 [Thermoproteota archaeon]|nr:hypothetical protein [Candidatus Brockarchaeota archaeon]
MPEVMIDLPEDLVRELEQISKLELSLVVSKLLKERLAKLARLERIVSKSGLSEEKAREIADEINLSLSKEYDKLFRKV